MLGNTVSIIVETCDFGRPYRDVISKHGYYAIEDLLDFSETWSVVLFQPFKATSRSQLVHILHDPDIREMWISLRYVITHFMRADKAHASNEACTAVAAHVEKYSRLVKALFGRTACTYNLHMIVCRYVRLSY